MLEKLKRSFAYIAIFRIKKGEFSATNTEQDHWNQRYAITEALWMGAFLNSRVFFFCLAIFIMKISNIGKNEQKLHSRHLYFFPLVSSINIHNTCFSIYPFMYPSTFCPSVHLTFWCSQSKLQTSVYFSLNISGTHIIN